MMATLWQDYRFLNKGDQRSLRAIVNHEKISLKLIEGFTVVSPTVCSPTTRVDSPTSYMSVRLRVKTLIHLLYVRSRSVGPLGGRL